MMAAAVEMLKVEAWSPPVPQVSMTPAPGRLATTGTRCSRMARAAPVISFNGGPAGAEGEGGGEEGADLGVGGLAGHDEVEGSAGLGLGESLTGGQEAEDGDHIRGASHTGEVW